MSKMSVLNQEQLRNEKAMVESFQNMFRMFEENQKGADDRVNFINRKSEFERLFLSLKDADDSDLYGRCRDIDHSINYVKLHSRLGRLNEMERQKDWEWEVVDRYIEDIEFDIQSLKDASYDEFLEDTFGINNI